MDQNEKTVKPDTAEPSPTKSIVDTVFDAVTAQTAKGLVLAKDALEIAARWLDARAKDVGELATKLGSSADRAAEGSTESL